MAHLLKQIITKNKKTNKIIGAAATATSTCYTMK